MPSRSPATFGWTPEADRWVAWAWRRLWTRGRAAGGRRASDQPHPFVGNPSRLHHGAVRVGRDEMVIRQPDTQRQHDLCLPKLRAFSSSVMVADSASVRAWPDLVSFSRVEPLACSTLPTTASWPGPRSTWRQRRAEISLRRNPYSTVKIVGMNSRVARIASIRTAGGASRRSAAPSVRPWADRRRHQPGLRATIARCPTVRRIEPEGV
jgi:hypothetical protein